MSDPRDLQARPQRGQLTRARPRGRAIASRGERDRWSRAQRDRSVRARRDRWNRKNARSDPSLTTRNARNRLKRFRQGSMLAVALTAMLLTIWSGDDAAAQQDETEQFDGDDTHADDTHADDTDGDDTHADDTHADDTDGDDTDGDDTDGDDTDGDDTHGDDTDDETTSDLEPAIGEATGTIRDLGRDFYAMLPKLAIAMAILLAAWLLGVLARAIILRALGRWERREAVAALTRIVIFLLALGAAMSVIAGDPRALVGSVGLVGLALSWALQTPIESFTGWLMNSFRGYYRVGDRIEVGDVFGDVYKIDVLTTTVWEAGGPGKAVAGAQATGAMITFPNWEVLRSNVINYTRDFPYVWDEVTINVSNDSDLPYVVEVFQAIAQRVVGPAMTAPAQHYEALLQRASLAFDVPTVPTVFLSNDDAWTNCTIRYLVPARERRRRSSELVLAIAVETAKPEHRDRIRTGYPRQILELMPKTPSDPREPR